MAEFTNTQSLSALTEGQSYRTVAQRKTRSCKELPTQSKASAKPNQIPTTATTSSITDPEKKHVKGQANKKSASSSLNAQKKLQQQKEINTKKRPLYTTDTEDTDEEQVPKSDSNQNPSNIASRTRSQTQSLNKKKRIYLPSASQQSSVQVLSKNNEISFKRQAQPSSSEEESNSSVIDSFLQQRRKKQLTKKSTASETHLKIKRQTKRQKSKNFESPSSSQSRTLRSRALNLSQEEKQSSPALAETTSKTLQVNTASSNSGSSSSLCVTSNRKYQKVGDQQPKPEKAGFDKSFNLGARLTRGSSGREPQFGSSDVQVKFFVCCPTVFF